ncbi:hypothetical protein ACLMJK_006308 [Lecanora helva]
MTTSTLTQQSTKESLNKRGKGKVSTITVTSTRSPRRSSVLHVQQKSTIQTPTDNKFTINHTDPSDDDLLPSTPAAAQTKSQRIPLPTPSPTPDPRAPKPTAATLNAKLRQALSFLRSPSPYNGYSFILRYNNIQTFLKLLSRMKYGSFDEKLYDEVQAWLKKRASMAEPERQWDFLLEDEGEEVEGDGEGSKLVEEMPEDRQWPFDNPPPGAEDGELLESLDEDVSLSMDLSPASATPSTIFPNTNPHFPTPNRKFLLAETSHLQTLFSDQIERDLLEDHLKPGDCIKPTVPAEVKFALPKPGKEVLEAVKGYLSGVVEGCGYGIEAGEGKEKGVEKGKEKGEGKEKRKVEALEEEIGNEGSKKRRHMGRVIGGVGEREKWRNQNIAMVL